LISITNSFDAKEESRILTSNEIQQGKMNGQDWFGGGNLLETKM